MTSVPTHHNPSNIILLLDQALRNEKNKICSIYKPILPNLKPYIYNLSKYSASFNSYIQIYVNGENFFPNGVTKVEFGNIKNIPISYISSQSFYFEVPYVAFPGIYNIIVKNNVNLFGKNGLSNFNNGLFLESNSIQFTITS